MVKTADDLAALVQAYPWYAPARAALCMAVLQEAGPEAAQTVFRQAVPYLPDAAYLAAKMQSCTKEDCTDANLSAILKQKAENAPRIIVAGGDFFSRADYESVRRAEDAQIRKIAIVDYSAPLNKKEENGEISGHTEDSEPANAPKPKEFWGDGSTADTIPDNVTETLAKIFINQGYPERAIDIYTKLSLHYPEKSAYFASLIENLRK